MQKSIIIKNSNFNFEVLNLNLPLNLAPEIDNTVDGLTEVTLTTNNKILPPALEDDSLMDDAETFFTAVDFVISEGGSYSIPTEVVFTAAAVDHSATSDVETGTIEVFEDQNQRQRLNRRFYRNAYLVGKTVFWMVLGYDPFISLIVDPETAVAISELCNGAVTKIYRTGVGVEKVGREYVVDVGADMVKEGLNRFVTDIPNKVVNMWISMLKSGNGMYKP